MTEGAARFSELGPRDENTGRLRVGFEDLGTLSNGLENGRIYRISGLNDRGGIGVFRLGQQLMIWLGVSNPVSSQVGFADNWITRIRLKPWWARPNIEFRVPGEAQGATQDSWIDQDTQVFGAGPAGVASGSQNNRYIWVPSPKRLDVTEFDGPNPPAAVVRTSDSLMLDDVWTLDLQDGNDATYIANFPAPQQVSRWLVFTYPAMGYALGFTWEATYAVVQAGNNPTPQVSFTYASGRMA